MSNTLPKVTSSSSFFPFLFIYLCDLPVIEQASHILLRGLPATATSGDVRRAVMLAGVLGVTDSELGCISNRFSS